MAEPTFAVENIGPDEAHALLEMNTHNRNIVNNAVREYAAAMKGGTWKFDGAPIRLDDEGVILDGQHRLTAVIESGTTQQFLVIYGVDKTAQATMDTGRKRSLVNILTLNGEKETTNLAALMMSAFRWSKGLRGYSLFNPGTSTSIAHSAKAHPQFPVLLEFLAENPELRGSSRFGLRAYNATNMPPRILSLAYWLFSAIDVEDAHFFFDHLKESGGLDEKHAILALKRQFTLIERDKAKNIRTEPEHILAYTILAWNYFRAGKSITRINYRIGGAKPDAFPEPK